MKKYKLFIDLDGTLCGDNEWTSFTYNTIKLFRTGLKLKIPKTLVWNILTSRPMIDKPIVKLVCKWYKLYPVDIITANSLFFDFNNKKEVINWKTSILSKCLTDNHFLDNVIYIDNDNTIISGIISFPGLILGNTESLNNIIDNLNKEVK